MTKTTHLRALFLLAAVVVAQSAAQGAELRLRAECTPTGAMVRLGDVAEVLANDTAVVAQLSTVELFPVPAAGAQRYVRLREVQDLLLLRGVNLAQHQFAGANQVLVRGAVGSHEEPEQAPTAAITRKATTRAREAILQYLRQHVSADEPWTVELDVSPSQSRLLAGYSGLITVSGGAAPWNGTQRFELGMNAGEKATRVAIEAQVGVPPAVVVIVRPLTRGAVIRETDVELQRGIVADAGPDVICNLEEAVGRETTRTISAGKPLMRDAVRAPLAVRRGDVVTVYARSPGIQIRTTARAKDDGAIDELVPVESFHDRSSFLARVCGIREVEVFAHAPQIEAQPAPKATVANGPKTAVSNPAVRYADHRTPTQGSRHASQPNR